MFTMFLVAVLPHAWAQSDAGADPGVKPTRVAIHTFEAAGVDGSLAIALKPFLKKELGSSPNIVIVEESRLDDALEYIKLRQSGLCNPDYCPVEPGKFLTAQKIITGAISKLGHKYYLSLSVIDVQSLHEEYTDTVECACAEGNLNRPMLTLGRRTRTYLTKESASSSPRALTPGTSIQSHSGDTSCPNDMVYIPDGHFCIDRYEYPNKLGVVPTNNMIFADAAELCANDGKRLPTSRELTTACAGPDNQKYAYGPTYDTAKCWTVGRGFGLDSAIKPSGSYPKCVSPYGVYDMSGNLFEYADGGVKVGWFKPSNRKAYECSAAFASASILDRQLFGFRCAMDATGEPPRRAATTSEEGPIRKLGEALQRKRNERRARTK